MAPQKTIRDLITAIVPARQQRIFLFDPCNEGDMLTWSASSICGLHCEHALKAAAYLVDTFDPACSDAIWEACNKNLLCICYS